MFADMPSALLSEVVYMGDSVEVGGIEAAGMRVGI
jgi:hypothetical protein